MTSVRLAGLAALSLLAACSPAPDTQPESAAPEPAASDTAATAAAAPNTAEPDAAAPETPSADIAAPDAAALHALLVEHAGELVPSDWNSGEPVSETSMTYWVLPALDVEETRSAACTPLAEPARAHDCTLSFVAQPEEANRRPVEARFRFNVAEGADGELILLSPAVRWAVTG